MTQRAHHPPSRELRSGVGTSLPDCTLPAECWAKMYVNDEDENRQAQIEVKRSDTASNMVIGLQTVQREALAAAEAQGQRETTRKLTTNHMNTDRLAIEDRAEYQPWLKWAWDV